MPRKKETPKPLFAVKHDFVASLDRFCHEALGLMQVCESALKHNQIGEPLREIFEERVKALRDAMLSDEE